MSASVLRVLLLADTHLGGRPLAAPVLYPGAIERTSFAERDESRGFLVLEMQGNDEGGCLVRWRFHALLSRPMVLMKFDVGIDDADALVARLRSRLAVVPPRAVVRLTVVHDVPSHLRSVLTTDSLHTLAPPDIIVDLHGPWRHNLNRKT